MILSSFGGTSVLFRLNSNWSHLYFTAMLKGTVKLSLIHLSIGVASQVSPPRPGMLSTLSSDSFLQEASDANKQKKRSIFCVWFTRKFFICLSLSSKGTNQRGTRLSMISSSYD